MASSNLKRGGNALLFAALTIGIVVFVNIISSRFFRRLDLTQEGIYTLSDASKKLVADLPDRVTVKFFVSADLPQHPRIRAIERYTRDMLSEYAVHSGGKFVWEAIDPGTDDKLKAEARRLKVQPRNLAVHGQTKSQVAQAYMGIAFQYQGKVESIPFVLQMEDFEYQVSSTLRQLTSKKKKIGFSSGHGEPPTARGLQLASRQLKQYEVTTVDLAEGKKPIPDDVDVLLIIGPKKPFAERAKYEIDAFLQKGKGLALFYDGTVLETPRGQFGGQTPPRIARANNLGLNEMFETYGVKLTQDIVMDRQNQRVQLPAGQGQRVITNYPAFPIVTTFDKDHPVTRKLKVYVSIFPSSVELTKEAREGKGGVKGRVLASSSSASWRHKGFFLFDPLRQPQPTKELGPFPLAVAVKGTIPSFFSGKETPKPGPAAATPKEKAKKPDGKKRSPDTARLVVVGDSELVQDQFLGLSQGRNLTVLLNTVDFLAQDESLIAIRAKAQTSRPLENVEDSSVTMAKLANIVGLPLAFIAFGVIRWRLRRGSRQRAAEQLLALKPAHVSYSERSRTRAADREAPAEETEEAEQDAERDEEKSDES